MLPDLVLIAISQARIEIFTIVILDKGKRAEKALFLRVLPVPITLVKCIYQLGRSDLCNNYISF